EYLYLTRGYHSLHKLPYFANAFFGLTLTATNSKGVTSTYSVTVRAGDKQPSIQNVAIGVPVYLNFISTTPNISITTKPTGSNASISPVSASPYTVVSFTPDLAGVYVVTDASTGVTITTYAGSWVGAIDSSGGYSNCTTCHNDIIAPNKFTSWAQTPHATMFTRGISGQIIEHGGPYYKSLCLACHTVGFDQAQTANNNGFDDVMATVGWIFPSTLQPSNWTNMLSNYASLAKLANIQCENCHGPNNSSAHMSTNTSDNGPRIGWDAGVCNQCHDKPVTHMVGSQWAKSGHANLQLAIDEATVESRGTSAGHCGRYHSAQGFNKYLDQVASGINDGTKPLVGLNVTGLANLGLTKSNVQPQTCQACHDPHDAGTPAQLRVFGNTFTLAAGFTAASVGAGAICMECHNTRNGEHDDSISVYSYTAPHTPSQADILMGQNSYFTNVQNVSYISKHANIGDTCVTCHMTLNPNQSPTAEAPYHGFVLNPQDKPALCASCHGSGVTGEALQSEVESLLAQLSNKLGVKTSTFINTYASTNSICVNNWDPVTDTYNPTTLIVAGSGTSVTSATFLEIHGQEGYQLWTSSSPAPYYSQLGAITFTTSSCVGATGTPVFALSNPTATTIVKAGWNYALVEGDGSLGIHNPTYVLTILNNTLYQLNQLP
ncbi:MAG: multiheme c-type cytochrome, partial [bacterium]